MGALASYAHSIQFILLMVRAWLPRGIGPRGVASQRCAIVPCRQVHSRALRTNGDRMSDRELVKAAKIYSEGAVLSYIQPACRHALHVLRLSALPCPREAAHGVTTPMCHFQLLYKTIQKHEVRSLRNGCAAVAGFACRVVSSVVD